MQSNTIELIKRDFAFEEESLVMMPIICWQKQEKEFNIHIFSCVYENEGELMKHYGYVRDYIAIFFQSETLTLDVERWNIYEFLFIKEKISDEIKQLVEQDKFSTRKIIFDEIGLDIDEEFLRQTIIDELFIFNVQKQKYEHESIEVVMSKNHSEMMKLINENEKESSRILTSLITMFGNG